MTSIVPSYRQLVLEEILRMLKQDVVFDVQSGDTCQPIDPAKGIVFRKVSVKVREINEQFTMEPVFPGIVVSPPFDETINFADGEVAHDEYVYHWLLQIIDSDNYEPTTNINTYWKWQEQVLRLLNGQCLNIDAPKVFSKAVNVDVVDERKWLKDQNFVCGVHVAVQIWMTRGATV